ncbi:trans-sulfuration enzyme family protein [Alkalibacillus haloalkaliphilus]|uniref:trans-sulfuration enzyme family protein n=1 Tax=Alkalibacillus haloalkaliphilus TaxID=94136 RepID=UPI00293547F9|nr:PLP-dependent aspartate aminotransferase family protein [Alkalibacillus haloalkaliphilus]MDV2581797.1 PLP-dependent aspartate aminotransferase family protein [Alkalibacillus haloalkaliphilus]
MTEQSFNTKIVHNNISQQNVGQSKSTPIYQTSAFTFKDLDHVESYYAGDVPYLYTRENNPNTNELGQAVAQLEGAPAGVASSSGISAIMAGIFSVVEAGDHIVAAEDLYGGTQQLITKQLSSFGIDYTIVDFSSEDAIKQAIQPNTKLLYTESVTNPFLRVENIEQLVNIAKEHNLKTMVDNTFATPYLLQPYTQGVDLVAHSATKYIGGHSDVTSGVVVGHEELISKANQKVVGLGTNLSPFEAWLTQRGLKTLALRMKQQSENANAVAGQLQQSEDIKQVYYPQNVSENGHGAIVTIELAHHVNVDTFFKSLDWIKIVPTLAGVETTVSYPIATSHRALTDEERQTVGINEYVVRISIGIEEVQDITNQLLIAVQTAK